MEGYSEEDIPLPESCGPGESGIAIDKEMRTAIIREAAMQDPKMKTGIPAVGFDDRPIPKTMDRIICDFTPDERRVLYDFAVSKTGAPPVMKVEELHMPLQKEEQKRPKTFIERLAEERDAKRRKVSKKVHTNRKSYTEILREVLQNQMELYEDFLKQENEEFKFDTARKSRKEYDIDHDLLDSESTSIVACSSKKDSLRYKERTRDDQKDFKRHGHSQSLYRTQTKPGRSHLKHEDSHHFQQDRWQRKSEYDRGDGGTSHKSNSSHRDRSSSTHRDRSSSSHRDRSSSSHRDRNSKNLSTTVRETSERHHKSKYTHSHRREEFGKFKRRHRTHSSSDSSNSSEDIFHKRKRSRDAEFHMAQM
ncbi:U11/U12 small nuclear ribonucleoprotein 48 kDa protein isoform X2 [Cryptotermes secundus]|nr:U11/U12 small nuclear ribonucleoprotein 48 kDa protein isoform X2 [Cryptotermes secundus]